MKNLKSRKLFEQDLPEPGEFLGAIKNITDDYESKHPAAKGKAFLSSLGKLKDGIDNDYSIRRYVLSHADVLDIIDEVFKKCKYQHKPDKDHQFDKNDVIDVLTRGEKPADLALPINIKLIEKAITIIEGFGRALDISMDDLRDKSKKSKTIYRG